MMFNRGEQYLPTRFLNRSKHINWRVLVTEQIYTRVTLPGISAPQQPSPAPATFFCQSISCIHQSSLCYKDHCRPRFSRPRALATPAINTKRGRSFSAPDSTCTAAKQNISCIRTYLQSCTNSNCHCRYQNNSNGLCLVAWYTFTMKHIQTWTGLALLGLSAAEDLTKHVDVLSVSHSLSLQDKI